LDIAPRSLVELKRRFRGAAFITRAMVEDLMMEAVRTSETSVFFNHKA
jgi:hypothetical protein